MAKNKIKPKGRPARTTLVYPERFMIRCTPSQLAAWKAEAERRGLWRGEHDTGVGVLARMALDALVAASGRPVKR